MRTFRAWCPTPIGPLLVEGTEVAVRRIAFGRRPTGASGPVPAVLAVAVRELEEYFGGRRREFSFALDLVGTPFQKRVWEQLTGIPFGRTATYGGIASALGRPGAARAVGGANHRNPAVIVVPCHRVIGAGSSLTGYGGGLWRKRWLIAHERSVEATGRPASRPGGAGRSSGRNRG